MTDTQKAIRVNLFRLIEGAHITPSALAKRAGVAASTLNRFCYQDAYPSTLSNRTLSKLSRALGVAPSEFYVGVMPDRPKVESSIEDVARALCKAKGLDPDAPMWTSFTRQAEQALASE